MKLIIDIPEGIYEALKHKEFKAKLVADNLKNAVANGKPYEERPQGEWEESHIFSCGNILRMGINVIEHKCKNCGRWSIKWVRTIPDNFCPNCGAQMVGGAKE